MINLNMSNNNSLQGNVFVKPEDQRESSLALAWRENEGKVNVFVKPEDQREHARFGLARKPRQSQRFYDYMTSTL